MGYRSTVALVLSADGVEALGKYMERLWEHDNRTESALAEYLGEADVYKRDDKGNVFFLWDDVKWYCYLPEYEGPYHIERFVNTIGDIQDTCGLSSDDFLFIRLGDDIDDVHVMGNMWDNPFNVGIRREIVYDDCR